MFAFDEYGNLTPYERIIVTSLDEFEQAFVSSFPLSVSRSPLFANLLRYLADMSHLLDMIAYRAFWSVWIDGSFTTHKQNPKDIDVLNVLDDVTLLHQNKAKFFAFGGNAAASNYGVDAYFLLKSNAQLTQELLQYWQTQFGTDRTGRSKGIIESLINR